MPSIGLALSCVSDAFTGQMSVRRQGESEQDRRRRRELRFCSYCRQPFYPTNQRQRYCKELCRERGQALDIKPLEQARCSWCGKRFEKKKPWQEYCSSTCRLQAFKARPCLYCGLPADTKDHFIPRVYVSRMTQIRADLGAKAKLIVPACRECNSTAGDHIFDTISEKRTFIKQQYRKKYRKLLESPNWTEDELNQLGLSLQTTIRASQAGKELMKARLRWPRK